MKRITLYFIGEPGNNRFAGEKGTTQDSSRFNPLYGGDEQVVDSSQVAGNLSAIQKFINPDSAQYSDINNKISNQINTKETDPLYQQAVKYAYPDLSQEDFTPGYQKGPVVGDAESKTLGKYPLFSSAVIVPSDIYAKKRAAITDYMEKMELAKQKTEDKFKLPEYNYVSGDADFEGALNDYGIELYDKNLHEGQQTYGATMAQAFQPGHPAYANLIKDENNIKSIGNQTTEAKKAYDAINKDFLNSGTFISNKAQESANWLNTVMGVGKEHQLTYLRSDKIPDPDHKNEYIPVGQGMAKAAARLTALPNLQSFVDSSIKDIQDKGTSWIESNPGANLDQWIVKSIKSKVPPVDSKGNVNYTVNKDGSVELKPEAEDAYITKIAQDMAIQKPTLFQETSGNKDAPFSMSQLKDYVKDKLGYEFTNVIHTATPGGVNAQAGTSAAPTALNNYISNISKGNEPNIPGERIGVGSNGVAFLNDKGETVLVPKENRQELVTRLAPYAGKASGTNEAEVIANAPKELYTSNPMSGRPVASTSGNLSTAFNENMRQFSGDKGWPIQVGGESGLEFHSMSSKGIPTSVGNSNNNFYFKARKPGDEWSQGVVIPTDLLATQHEEPSTFLGVTLPAWLSTHKEQAKSISVGGKATVLGNTYYHKEKPDTQGNVYYTVYDKSTNQPYKSPLKDKEDGTYSDVPIKVPEYYVDGIVNKPKQIIDEANTNFKAGEGTGAPSSKVTTTPNPATKASKSGSVTRTNEPDNNANVELTPEKLDKAAAIVLGRTRFQGDTSSTYQKQQALLFLDKLKNSSHPDDVKNYNAIISKIK